MTSDPNYSELFRKLRAQLDADELARRKRYRGQMLGACFVLAVWFYVILVAVGAVQAPEPAGTTKPHGTSNGWIHQWVTR